MSGPARTKILLGIGCWVALGVAVTAAYGSISPQTRTRIEHVKLEIWRALLEPPPTYDVHFANGTKIERGNSVLAVVSGKLERVGEVAGVRRDVHAPGDALVTLALDDKQAGVAEWLPRADTIGVRRSQGNSLLFALKTLLPQPRWQQVRHHWESFRQRHAAEFTRELQPIATRLLTGALAAISAELPVVLERHHVQLEALARRMRDEVAREQLEPLFVQDLWPIVMKHAAEPAERIGRELWERAPLMSFALRAAADRVLEERPVRVEERWRKFVDEEALPLLATHQAEMEELLGQIVRDTLASEAVRARATAVWQEIKGDPQVQSLAKVLLRELVAENPRLEAFLRALPDDPELRAKLTALAEPLQEFLDPVGDLLFLDESGKGINPELAYLIRLLLLRRDEQVIYLEGGNGDPLAAGSEFEGRHEP